MSGGKARKPRKARKAAATCACCSQLRAFLTLSAGTMDALRAVCGASPKLAISGLETLALTLRAGAVASVTPPPEPES